MLQILVEFPRTNGIALLLAGTTVVGYSCYDILIKIETKGGTAMDLNNFYNHINMCLNEVTRLLEDLLPVHDSIKRHSEFEE